MCMHALAVCVSGTRNCSSSACVGGEEGGVWMLRVTSHSTNLAGSWRRGRTVEALQQKHQKTYSTQTHRRAGSCAPGERGGREEITPQRRSLLRLLSRRYHGENCTTRTRCSEETPPDSCRGSRPGRGLYSRSVCFFSFRPRNGAQCLRGGRRERGAPGGGGAAAGEERPSCGHTEQLSRWFLIHLFR